MSEEPQQVRTKLERLWSEFLDARDRAQLSGQLEDGVEAGRAWSRWLGEFCPDGAAKQAVHGNVVGLPR